MSEAPEVYTPALLSAAPDMLAALKAYVIAEPQCCCSEHSGCKMADARAGARAAIAKAEGRT